MRDKWPICEVEGIRADELSDPVSRKGVEGNDGVPRGKSTSKVETCDIGDRGEAEAVGRGRFEAARPVLGIRGGSE